MRINIMLLLILPLTLTAMAGLGGCARRDGIPAKTEEDQKAHAVRPTLPGAVPYNSPVLRISYDRLSLLDDGTALVFLTYMNVSDATVIEILVDDAPATPSHPPGSKHMFLNSSGSSYRLADAGQLQDPAGLRLFPRSSVKAGFVFRLEGSRSRWLTLCGRPSASAGYFHLISGQRVREFSAEASGEDGRDWGLSLVLNNITP